MAVKMLEANVRRASSAVVIDLSGEIDSFGEEALNNAYAEAVRYNPSAIALNFGGVEYINSTGIALIVGVLAQERKAGRRLLTFGLSPHYQEIFQITRLSDFMGIYPDEAAALSSA